MVATALNLFTATDFDGPLVFSSPAAILISSFMFLRGFSVAFCS